MGRPASAEHGTPSKYTGGCRCAECTEANRVRIAEYRSRRAGVEKVLPATRPTMSATTGGAGHTPYKKLHDQVMSRPGAPERVAALKKMNEEIIKKAMAPKLPIQAPRSALRYQIPQKPPPRIDNDGMVHEEAGWD